MKLEIIAFNILSCFLAQNAGADRIELCDNPAEGGTTPSYGLIKQARKFLDISLFPMIRPRGGHFVYSPHEYEIMKNDIQQAKNFGCDGVVFGGLNFDGTVNIEENKKLVELAYPLECTFHRAFDRTNNIFEALENVIDCGFTRILTSGGFPNVDAGIENLVQLVEKANDRIIIMPGSGIRSSNLSQIINKTSAKEYHSSAMKKIELKEPISPNTMNEKWIEYSIDEEEVKLMQEILNNYEKK